MSTSILLSNQRSLRTWSAPTDQQHVEENDVWSAVQLGRFGQDRVIEGHPLDGRRFVAVSDDQLLWTRELDDLEGLRAGIEGALSRTRCLDSVDPVDDMNA